MPYKHALLVERSAHLSLPESDDVGVFELAQVLDVSLFDVPHFLHCHFLSV